MNELTEQLKLSKIPDAEIGQRLKATALSILSLAAYAYTAGMIANEKWRDLLAWYENNWINYNYRTTETNDGTSTLQTLGQKEEQDSRRQIRAEGLRESESVVTGDGHNYERGNPSVDLSTRLNSEKRNVEETLRRSSRRQKRKAIGFA